MFQTGSRPSCAIVVAWSAVSKFMESADTCDGAGDGPLQWLRKPLACDRSSGLSVSCGSSNTTQSLLRLPKQPSRKTVHVEFADKLDPEAVSECSLDPLISVLVRGGSSCQSDTVRSTDVTNLALLSDQLDILLNLLSWLKSLLKNECAPIGVFLDETASLPTEVGLVRAVAGRTCSMFVVMSHAYGLSRWL